ncbi:SH3 and multiple ankyrin repeat domains protein 2b isoform X3 [Esox lucius]|uniref:SH3 and multiple ankyrin repeat domains protein 2b isoform X3 n=1 Tax=Esox lucius TaxID=8010 RepID=UPI001476C2CD|nr:SH3 and multiple ankyrin repeat domains protein 2b isoform X3 [Esox lucius]
MPRSPTSSEEEMAQSFSDGSVGFDTDSSREESGHGGAGEDRASRRSGGRAERDRAARRESLVFCVVIPDLEQSKCMRFKPEATVWVAKQQILCTLTQTLRDVLNYGLFQPAVDGRESGFLDEERPLKDYPTPTCTKGIPTLEFRYKSRVYQQPYVNEKQIAKIHTQANYRKLMDHIQRYQLDKLVKMLEKGLDPNYHDPETGETPLTFASHLDNVGQIIVALKQGGAHLDFRSQDGMTALHKAVRAKNQATLKALLDLGASPDYKDSQSLTPLYHSVLVGGDPGCCELLLRANATVSCHDENGWHEVHQACRYGHVQHMEHLLFYGADMSVQNASGNTALHICALHNQEHCARVLLLHGANKEVKNYRSQTPFQVAIIAGNFELAEFIKNHKDTDTVPFRESPVQPTRRQQAPRSTLAAPRPTLLRSNSDNNLNVNSRSPLPSPSHSPLSNLSPRRPQPMPSPNGTVRTMGRGAPRPPRSRSPSVGRLGEEARRQTPQRQPSPHRGREAFSGGSDCQGPKRKLYSAVPGKHYVVTHSYQPQAEGEITLYKNDRVKVLSIGEGGFWEGSARGNVGWFPSECVEEIPNQAQEDRPYARADRAERRKLFRHYTVGSYDSFDASSDCVIDEKTVVLQKKDNEGFGFVLRGAKADTPIEEFTPTPAFPALQYLESVDEGGVAWRAGLRNGDFLIEVNQENVVKVGHKQVVNTIRHGGNRLIIKVVTVSRNLDPDDTARKKLPTPPRRAPSAALSMAMRSKSMTSELEELVDKATLRKKTVDKVDENTPPQKPMWDNSSADIRVATTIKSRPNSRCFAMSPEINSMCESQNMSMQTQPREPGSPRGGGPHLGLPNRQGTVRRQKSIGTSGITEEETPQFLTPPMLKFTRSLSMPDTSEDIPPPPAISPPSPPYNNVPDPQGRGYGTIRHTAPKGTAPERGGDPNMGVRDGWREQGGMYYGETQSEQYQSENNHHHQGSHSPVQGLTAQQSFLNRRAQIPENPYSDLGKNSNLGLFAPNKPQRRKGMLVKQHKIEDSPEKTCIKIPTIIIKEPSTSSSGKSSQGSSMEIETGSHDHPGQLLPDDGHNPSSPFATAMAGAVRERERRIVGSRRNYAPDQGREDSPPAPRLRHSKSIDEGMFSSDERLRRILAPPASLLSIPRGGGNVTDFNSPEPTVVREPLHTRTGHHSPVSLPAKTYSSGSGHYVHPVTGKPLDPSSPLALALAARDRAMREQSQPLPLKTESPKPDLNKPLFIDTKLRTGMDAGFSSTATMGRPGRAGLRRQMTEAKYETESKYDHPLAKDKDKSVARPQREEEKKNMLIDIVDTSQQKSAGLLMVHTTDGARTEENSLSEGDRDGAVSPDSAPSELRDPNQPTTPKMASPNSQNPHSMGPGPRSGKTMITITSVEEPVKLPFAIPPPPCIPSVDIDDEFFSDPLPPPLEFANSFDIPEEQKGVIAELLKQQQNAGRAPSSLAPFYPHLGNSPGHPEQVPIKRSAVLTNCTPPSFPTGPLESYEPVGDSGIDVGPDSRSSGEPQPETTGTVSTVSDIYAPSSEGGVVPDNTVYADGQVFLVDRTLKPRARQPAANKVNALYKDPALVDREESLRTFGAPSSVPPPPPGAGGVHAEPPRTPTQRTSKLWGDMSVCTPQDMPSKDRTPKPGDGMDTSSSGCRTVFGSRGPDGGSLTSGTQRNTTVTFAAQLGQNMPAPLPNRQTDPHHRAPSPILSPPDSGLGCASSLPATSPTLSDVFGLPTPPLSLGTGSSRSPSPLSLMQAVSDKPFATKPVLMWSKHDVADWLASLNLAEHRDTFMDNDIEGSHLPSLQKDDLIDLGVTRVGHRMNIERALKLLMDR